MAAMNGIEDAAITTTTTTTTAAVVLFTALIHNSFCLFVKLPELGVPNYEK